MVKTNKQIKSRIETRKPLVSILYSVLIILFATNFIACEKENEPIKKTENELYFVSADRTKTYNRKDLVSEFSKDFSAIILSFLLPNNDVKIEKIKYRTKDPKGNPIIASGIISYPASGNLKGVVMGEHFTIGSNAEAPSERLFAMESILSLYDYLVISPDYIGFGETKELPHPYLHVNSTATASLDLLFAVREYMSMKNKPINDDIYIVGYSQGGAAALAVQKIAEKKYSQSIHINKVFAGGGAYDLAGIFDYFNKTNKSVYPCSLPYTVIGLNYGDQLNLDYSKIFAGSLLQNYTDLFESKKYTTGEMNRRINSETVSEFIHPDFFTEKKNSELDKVYTSLENNSLIDWTPKAPILLVHGVEDLVVPYLCATNAYNSFKEKGSNVELKSIESLDHTSVGPSFYLYVINELSK